MGFASWRASEIARLEAGSRLVATSRGMIEVAEIGRGPVILALHGRPGGYDQGLLIARSLGVDLGRWIAVSRPGYLRTPIEVGRTPAEQADAYASLLDALEVEKTVALGLSGGGPSAYQFALRHGDRCRGLVLVSAVSRKRPASARPVGQKVFDSLVSRSDRLAWRLLGLLGTVLGPGAREGLATVLVLPEELRGEGRRNDLAQFEALAEVPPTGIRAPTLILHGTADRIVSLAHAEAAAAAIPGATLVPIVGGGHDALFARSAETRTRIAVFLAALPPSP